MIFGKTITVCVLLLSATSHLFAVDSSGKIPAGSRVYVQPMDGFGSFIVAAIQKKEVALIVVADREKADFEISGGAESQKPGWAKILLTRQTGTAEEASITVTNIKTGEVAYAYNVNKGNSARGKQSTAEACAKHLKEAMNGK